MRDIVPAIMYCGTMIVIAFFILLGVIVFNLTQRIKIREESARRREENADQD